MEDYEKKYKEALKRAKKIYDNAKELRCVVEAVNLETIFPELKENEDEKIRKALIKGVESCKASGWTNFGNNVDIDVVIAWLEKQGSSSVKWQKNTPDNKPAINHSVLMKTTHGVAEGYFVGSLWYQFGWSSNIKDSDVLAWMELSDLDEQGEQKPIDSPISKDEILYQLVQNGTITAFDYLYLTRRWNNTESPKDYQDIDPHFGISVEDLMTKKNTDDKVEPRFNIGDVLCDKSCTTLDKNSQPNIEILDIRNGLYICNNCTFPISQQDEYELVAKKIEDEIEIPFGAKDSELQEVTYYIPKGFHAEIDDDKVVIKKGEKSTAWSEEDEREMKRIIGLLEGWLSTFKETCYAEDCKCGIDWLKSLKDRVWHNSWKPSEEQLDELLNVITEFTTGEQFKQLNSLYEHLIKL